MPKKLLEMHHHLLPHIMSLESHIIVIAIIIIAINLIIVLLLIALIVLIVMLLLSSAFFSSDLSQTPEPALVIVTAGQLPNAKCKIKKCKTTA